LERYASFQKQINCLERYASFQKQINCLERYVSFQKQIKTKKQIKTPKGFSIFEFRFSIYLGVVFICFFCFYLFFVRPLAVGKFVFCKTACGRE